MSPRRMVTLFADTFAKAIGPVELVETIPRPVKLTASIHHRATPADVRLAARSMAQRARERKLETESAHH